MAASAYKGLTIRIGADTTKLSSALRGANSAIYKTESEFRKLSKAAKLDPGNNNVVAAQIGAIASEAVASAQKLDTLKKSIAEMREQASSSEAGATIGMLADDTENAALAAENAKERYTALTAEIARVSDVVKELNGTDLSEAVRQSESEYEKAVESLREWASENQDAVEEWGRKNGTTLHETINYIEHLRDTWTEANKEMSDAQMVEALHNAGVEAITTEAKINGLARTMAEVNSASNFSKSKMFDGLDARLNILNAAAETATERFRRLDSAFQANPRGISTAVERAKALADATEVARRKADTLKQKIDAYKSAGIDKVAKSIGNVSLELKESEHAFTESETAVRKLEGELENASRHYQRLLEVEGSGGGNLARDINKAADECDRLERELREAKQARSDALDRFDTAKACSELQEMEDSVKQVGGELKTLKNESLPGVSTAAVQAASEIGNLMQRAGSAIVDASNDVDSAYRDMRKTVDGTEEQYKDLYDAAMKYSQTHVTSADTMLEMEALAGQVGISADALQNFAEVAANLDVATDIDAEEIALKMGQITNVMSDLNEENVQGFADALVDLGNKMPAQESAIMQIAQRLSSVGDVAGFTTPEVLGWAAAIASTGQRSEAAATGISTTITSIQSAVSNGGDELDAFAKVVDMSAEEFKKAWGEDASGVLREFIGSLQDLGPEAIAQLEQLGIEGVRQSQTLLGLAKTVDNVDKAIGLSQGAWDRYMSGNPIDGMGEAAQEASRKAEGFSGALAKMKNSAQVLAASLGDALVPAMNFASDVINKLTTFLDSLDEHTKSVGVGIGLFFSGFATMQPILSALFGNLNKVLVSGVGKMVTNIIGAKRAIGDFGAAIQLLRAGEVASLGEAFATGASGTGAFATALGFLTSPLGVVAASVGVLAAIVGGEYLVRTMKAKRETDQFTDAVDGIKDATEGLGRELTIGSNAIEEYADKWSAARVDMDEYHKTLQGHLDTQAGYRSSMGDTVAEFERYQEIIDGAVGKGEKFAGSIGELQWALDGLNKLTGESWSLQDVLTGKYENEEGAVRNTKEAIDDLIRSKEREARISATEDMLSENYKMQEENKLQRQLASSAYQDWIDMKLKVKHEGGLFSDMTDTEYIKHLQQTDEHTQELMLDSKRLREESRLLSDQQKDLTNTLDGLVDQQAYATQSAYGVRESVMQTDQAMKDALETYMGFDDNTIDQGIKDIALALQEAGVSADSFAKLSSEKFAELAEKSGGDIERFVQLIAEAANANPVEVPVDVDTTQAEDGIDQAKANAESDPATIPTDADTTPAEQSTEEFKDNVESEPVTQTVNAEVKTGEEAPNTTSEQTVTVNAVLNDSDATAKLEELVRDRQVNITAVADEESIAAASGAIDASLSGAGSPIGISSSVDTKAAVASIADLKRRLDTIPKNTPVSVKATVMNKDKVDALRQAIEKTPKNTPVRLSASVIGKTEVDNLANKLAGLNGTTYTVTLKTKYTSEGSKPALPGQSAAGAYIPPNKIPRHAAGIFTAPTLTNIGWVGEDGAELYSGNSLVPLTNRKYSMPFIDDISDAVSRKLGPVNGGNQITVTVTGVSSPDEVADAISRRLSILNF